MHFFYHTLSDCGCRFQSNSFFWQLNVVFSDLQSDQTKIYIKNKKQELHSMIRFLCYKCTQMSASLTKQCLICIFKHDIL